MLAGASAAALGLAVALMFAVQAMAVRSVRVHLSTVTINEVQFGVFHDFTLLNGKVKPHDTVDLDALEGGQVAKVAAQAGDAVVAGRPLVTFRNTTLELDVLDRAGRLVESITQLQSYEKQL